MLIVDKNSEREPHKRDLQDPKKTTCIISNIENSDKVTKYNVAAK